MSGDSLNSCCTGGQVYVDTVRLLEAEALGFGGEQVGGVRARSSPKSVSPETITHPCAAANANNDSSLEPACPRSRTWATS